LALLLFGIIQWGLIFAARVTVRNATINAARYATLKSGNSLNIASAENYAKQDIAPMLDPNNVTGDTVANVTVGGTNAVSVALTYKLKLIIPWVVYGTSVSNGQILVSATTTMMNATSAMP
jgi:hypothetical protein